MFVLLVGRSFKRPKRLPDPPDLYKEGGGGEAT